MEKLSHYYLSISRKKGPKQQKEIIDELAILLSVIIGAPSKKSNWIYLD